MISNYFHFSRDLQNQVFKKQKCQSGHTFEEPVLLEISDVKMCIK